MALLDKMPGVGMPVSEVPRALRELWKTDEGESPTKFRAVQSNLILHFGLEATESEAKIVLDRALDFARRYPSRLICLCPFREADDQLMRGKLFSQCYLAGGSKHPVCCEALMLGYTPEDAEFLEHQISVWLESDLPTYHWFHRVPEERILRSYLPFLMMVRRVTYDSSIEGHNFSGIDWPCPRGARDLADARLLHVRQSVGQFLSSYPVDLLSQNLESLTINHTPSLSGEANELVNWVQTTLIHAGVNGLESNGKDTDGDFRMDWTYSDEKFLSINLDNNLASGWIQADFGSGQVDYPLHLKKISPQLTLAEALFF